MQDCRVCLGSGQRPCGNEAVGGDRNETGEALTLPMLTAAASSRTSTPGHSLLSGSSLHILEAKAQSIS